MPLSNIEKAFSLLLQEDSQRQLTNSVSTPNETYALMVKQSNPENQYRPKEKSKKYYFAAHIVVIMDTLLISIFNFMDILSAGMYQKGREIMLLMLLFQMSKFVIITKRSLTWFL